MTEVNTQPISDADRSWIILEIERLDAMQFALIEANNELIDRLVKRAKATGNPAFVGAAFHLSCQTQCAIDDGHFQAAIDAVNDGDEVAAAAWMESPRNAALLEDAPSHGPLFDYSPNNPAKGES